MDRYFAVAKLSSGEVVWSGPYNGDRLDIPNGPMERGEQEIRFVPVSALWGIGGHYNPKTGKVEPKGER